MPSAHKKEKRNMIASTAAPRRERLADRFAVQSDAIGPSVWTGRALQAENDDLEKVGLALLYPAY
jgi:hypothetical protein